MLKNHKLLYMIMMIIFTLLQDIKFEIGKVRVSRVTGFLNVSSVTLSFIRGFLNVSSFMGFLCIVTNLLLIFYSFKSAPVLLLSSGHVPVKFHHFQFIVFNMYEWTLVLSRLMETLQTLLMPHLQW